MTKKSSDYFDVDKAAAQADAAQLVARHFGVGDEELHLRGEELRTRCFLQCGKSCPTGDRVLAIQVAHQAKLWKCHNYDCPGKFEGNLVRLVALAMGHTERLRGDAFKVVRDKMREIFTGELTSSGTTTESPTPPSTVTDRGEPAADKPHPINIPLAEHPQENVRAVADLYEKLTLDVSQMPPHAARYVRERSFLTPEVAARRQLGYLPRDTGGDKSGGTQRGKFVVALHDAEGRIVGYMGRDTDWEKKHQAWVAGGRSGKEPAKWTIPRSLHRGVIVYGQHELTPQRVGIKLKQIGLPVVEGPLDQVNLAETLNVPSAAILSNAATDHQIERIAELAHQVAGGVVTLLYDCDEQGDQGMDRDSVKFAKHCRVQRAWARDMHGGRFAGMQPEQMTMEGGGKFLRDFLTRREAKKE